MNLHLFADDMIPVYKTDLGNKVVMARELYKFLGIKRQFANWIKEVFALHKLVEGKDYAVFNNFVKNSKGGRKATDYILRLHSAKKIALGTNNEQGDKIKDYFIKCEEVVQELKGRVLNISDYSDHKIQKGLTKQVASTLYHNGEASDIIEHHQKNCKIHFGVQPSELKKEMKEKGMKCKSLSSREIARRVKPEAACSMAYHDEMVANGHTLEKLEEIKLKEKLEPAFKAMMELGFTPSHLLK